MHNKRILMFTMGKWSHSNDAIADALRKQLPQWKLLEIDLLREFRRERKGMLACLLKDIPFMLRHALREGSLDKTSVIYAPATSRYINGLANRLKLTFKPALTLQTTTRFDASGGGIPHFTVIDSTLRAVQQHYRDLFHAPENALERLSAFQHRIYSASNGIFTMGRYVCDSLVRDYGIPKNCAFAMGAGPNIELGARSEVINSQNILFVGTNWQRKGGPTLLAAFRLLKKKYPYATLNIVGCAPDIREDGVNIIGRVAREELHKYFSAARVFALPTQLEAFGIVFVEALHFGLPIVATSINAIPEMVEDGVNGCTIKQGDVPALTEALDKILGSDEIATAYGNASYERAHRFTWDQAAHTLSKNMLQLAQPEHSSGEPQIPDFPPPLATRHHVSRTTKRAMSGESLH